MQARRSLNPKVYKADYFGHKLHVDQNKNLILDIYYYRATHAIARNGYSEMITGYTTVTVKSN